MELIQPDLREPSLWMGPIPSSASAPPRPPHLLCFYSYRDSAERTTCLLSVLMALLRRDVPARVLLVDASLEDPGLTFLLRGPVDAVSLVDLLHGTPAGTVPLFIERLLQNRRELEVPGGRAGFHFLPACADLANLFTLPPSMAQRVLGHPGHPVLQALSRAAQVLRLDAVLLDLQAGINDLSTPFLLGPGVQPVVVTSCQQHSLAGTTQVLLRLRQLGQHRPRVLLATGSGGGEEAAARSIAEKRLRPFARTAEAGAPFLFEVPLGRRLSGQGSLAEVVAGGLCRGDLGRSIAPHLAQVLLPPVPRPGLFPILTAVQALERGEQNARQGLSPSRALRHLLASVGESPKSAVVLGEHGAGKTFAFGQLLLGNGVADFAAQLAPGRETGTPGPPVFPPVFPLVFPLIVPQALGTGLKKRVQEVETSVYQRLGTTQLASALSLRAALSRGQRARDPHTFWLAEIASRIGLSPREAQSFPAVSAAIARRGVSLLLLVDGLDEVKAEQVPVLRGLLELPRHMDSLSLSHVGLLIFAGTALAQEALGEAYPALAAQHQPFALSWNEMEIRQLADWTLRRVGLRGPITDPWQPREELRHLLGTFADRWLAAALHDPRVPLLPGDVVRLLRFAAQSHDHRERLVIGP